MSANVSKFENFLRRELDGFLKDVLVFADDDGTYELFNKYKIRPAKNGYYKVSLYTHGNVHEFASIRNAVTWCTFDDVGKYYEANRIKELDLRLCGIDVDIAVHRRLSNRIKDNNNKWIYIIKYQEDMDRKRIMVKELNSYINTSKMIQAKRFNKTKQLGFNNLR